VAKFAVVEAVAPIPELNSDHKSNHQEAVEDVHVCVFFVAALPRLSRDLIEENGLSGELIVKN
jgi:hypothetical protein